MNIRCAALLLCVAACASSSAVALTTVTNFGSNPGALTMYEHVPAGVGGAIPLVLVLHGCTQNSGYADAVGLVDFADSLAFGLVVAETNSSNNQNRCFNWFESGDIAQGSGEALSLANMVASFKNRHTVDDDRVFVTGLSAGGAMTAVMLAVEPDVFAAGAVFAGVPYNCGTGSAAAFSCMNPGSTKTQAQWAALVESATDFSGTWPRVLVVHGSSDSTVVVKNAENLTLQFTGVHGLPVEPTTNSSSGDLTTKVWRSGNVDVVKSIVVAGMNHGMPVAPPTCGTAGAFVLDQDFCGSLAALEFFGLVGEGEGEGEGEEGEGEGEEGEGEPAEGEGEGAEGEGEGAQDTGERAGCDSSSTSNNAVAGAVLALLARRRRRH